IAVCTGVALWRAAEMTPFGRGYFVIGAAALASYGAVGLFVRIALGSTVVGLAAAFCLGTVLYALLLRRLVAEVADVALVRALAPRIPSFLRPAALDIPPISALAAERDSVK